MARISLYAAGTLFLLGLLFFVWEELSSPVKYTVTKSPISDSFDVQNNHIILDKSIVPFVESNRTDDSRSWYTLRTLKDMRKGEVIKSSYVEMVGMKRETVPAGVIWSGPQFTGCKMAIDVPRNSLLKIGNFKTFPNGSYYLGSDRKTHTFMVKETSLLNTSK